MKPVKICADGIEPLPKDPRNYRFPQRAPDNCNRDCRQFYVAHTKTISFALYSTQDPTKEPGTICAYAFSCGQDIESYKAKLRPGESPADLVRRLVPELVNCFIEIAMAEKEISEVKDN